MHALVYNEHGTQKEKKLATPDTFLLPNIEQVSIGSHGIEDAQNSTSGPTSPGGRILLIPANNYHQILELIIGKGLYSYDTKFNPIKESMNCNTDSSAPSIQLCVVQN